VSAASLSLLANLVLFIHVGVVLFNVGGLIAIPFGARRGWRFVYVFWWRALHLGLLFLVAAQALLGRACFLTLWQSALETASGAPADTTPLVQRWAEAVLFWDLPLWVFTALYILVLAYAVFLWWRVPPQRSLRAAVN
jgi:hypothetical protein